MVRELLVGLGSTVWAESFGDHVHVSDFVTGVLLNLLPIGGRERRQELIDAAASLAHDMVVGFGACVVSVRGLANSEFKNHPLVGQKLEGVINRGIRNLVALVAQPIHDVCSRRVVMAVDNDVINGLSLRREVHFSVHPYHHRLQDETHSK